MSKKKFSVNFWGTHPDEKGSDGCFYGTDCSCRKEAMTIFRVGCQDTTVQYIQIIGPGINKVRKNPSYRSYEDEGYSWKDEAYITGISMDEMMEYSR